MSSYYQLYVKTDSNLQLSEVQFLAFALYDKEFFAQDKESLPLDKECFATYNYFFALQFLSNNTLFVVITIALRRIKGDERSLKIPLFKQFGNRHGKARSDRNRFGIFRSLSYSWYG